MAQLGNVLSGGSWQSPGEYYGELGNSLLRALSGSSATTYVHGLSDKYLGTTFNSDRQRAEDMAFNAQQSQIQRDWTEMMFDRANAWNSESAQVGRLRAAGLNPSMMMAGGLSGASATVPSGSEAQYNGAVGLSSGNLADLLRLPSEVAKNVAQAQEVESRIPLNEQRINNLKREEQKLLSEAAKLGVEADIALSTKDSTIAMLESKNRLSRSESDEAAKYVSRLAKINADIVEQRLVNLQKEGMVSDEEVARIREQTRKLKAEADVAAEGAKHPEAAYWIEKISNVYQLSYLIFQGISESIKQGNPLPGHYSTEGDHAPVVLPPYQ